MRQRQHCKLFQPCLTVPKSVEASSLKKLAPVQVDAGAQEADHTKMPSASLSGHVVNEQNASGHWLELNRQPKQSPAATSSSFIRMNRTYRVLRKISHYCTAGHSFQTILRDTIFSCAAKAICGTLRAWHVSNRKLRSAAA